MTDESGNALTLAESNEGIYQAGSYYDYIKGVIEASLNNFLADTEFPYTASSNSGFGGGRGGMGGVGGFGGPNGEKPDMDFGGDLPEGGFGGMQAGEGETDYAAMDGIERTNTSDSLSINGTYETAQDYIDALNANGEWVIYDAATNTATITSVANFTKALKTASKGIAAFDQLDCGQGENVLFGYGDGSGAHFDAILAELVEGSAYEKPSPRTCPGRIARAIQ